jgi:hypothetical protein
LKTVTPPFDGRHSLAMSSTRAGIGVIRSRWLRPFDRWVPKPATRPDIRPNLEVMAILDIQPPQEPNAGGSFESLRMTVHRHAQSAIEMKAAQPQAHIKLRVTIIAVVARAEMVEEELGAANPTTPTDVESRKRQLAEARDIERAHNELLTALHDTCGATCLSELDAELDASWRSRRKN